MIGIVDYGAGNLLSVKKALEHLNVDCKIINSESDFKEINKIILPGVGAFHTAIQNLKSSGIYKIIRDWIKDNKPFLGICLGMQLLFEESEESAGIQGLEIFKGKVIRFNNQKVPQIGWNQVRTQRKSKLINGINDLSFFYFLHGYFVEPQNDDIVTGVTEYGVVYPSIIEKDNIFAVQFHPEKSGDVGLKLLKNWVNLC